MDTKLLESLVCPQCHHALDYHQKEQQLHCTICSLAFLIEDGIPIMLLEAAQPLNAKDI